MKAYKQLLSEFVRLRSISTDPAYKEEVRSTADWLQQQFMRHGFTVRIATGEGYNPVVMAHYDAGKAVTVLVYGHYDVQPAELTQGWTTDPFGLRESDGRLYGRGVVDNKGQILTHMVSVFEAIAEQALSVNVTFVVEGNEETGNPKLAEVISQHQDFLACQHILISDGEIVGDIPTLEASLRGGFNMRIRLRTAKNDLHSGLAGGAVPSASHTLTHLLSQLIDSRGQVLVPNFYEGVTQPQAVELQANRLLEKSQQPANSLGVSQLLSANDTDFYTQTGAYPTLQISGINSGYTGNGFANIVPAQAEARINVRTAPGQDSNAVATATTHYLESLVPMYAQASIEVVDPHPPVVLRTDTTAAKRVKKLLKAAYGHPPLVKRVGGAIPIVADFKQLFAVDPLLVSLGNDDCNMHGANENFRLDLVHKGLDFSRAFFRSSW